MGRNSTERYCLEDEKERSGAGGAKATRPPDDNSGSATPLTSSESLNALVSSVEVPPDPDVIAKHGRISFYSPNNMSSSLHSIPESNRNENLRGSTHHSSHSRYPGSSQDAPPSPGGKMRALRDSRRSSMGSFGDSRRSSMGRRGSNHSQQSHMGKGSHHSYSGNSSIPDTPPPLEGNAPHARPRLERRGSGTTLNTSLTFLQSPMEKQENGPVVAPLPQALPSPQDTSNWVQDIEADIQPLPMSQPTTATAAAQQSPPRPELRYDNRGRVLKSCFTTSNDPSLQPGAYLGNSARVYSSVIPVPDYSLTLGESAHSHALDRRPSVGPFDDNSQRSCEEGGSGAFHSMEQPEGLEDKDTTEGDDGMDPKSSPRWWQRPFCVAAVVVLLLVLLLAIALPIVLLQEDKPTEDIAMVPKGASPDDGLDLCLVPNLTDATIQALQDPHSPQFQAYDWISRDPNWGTFPDYRKQQRFALSCFYHSLKIIGAVGQSRRFVPSYLTHECDWLVGADACDNGEDDRLTFLGFAVPDNRGVLGIGYVPPELSFLSHLESIDLSTIQLRILLDTFPPFLDPTSFPYLKEVLLHDAALEGTIPSTVGLLTSLTHLDLSMNKLNATIPSELGLLSNLVSLVLSGNNLSGTLPDEIGDLSSLVVFHVEENPDAESILPTGLCDKHHSLLELQTDWCSDPVECCSN